MDNIEQLYQEYVVPEDTFKKIRNQFFLVLNIEMTFKHIQKAERELAKRIRRNQMIEKIFASKKEILDAENSVYLKMIELIEENLDYFIAITREVDANNYRELTKLMDFIITHFTGNLLYYEAQREGIHQALKGIQFIDNSKQNTREAIKAFFEKKVAELKVQKQLEKKYEV